jgi:uncharacterized membrane protein
MTPYAALVALHLLVIALGLGFSTSNFVNTRLALKQGPDVAKGLALHRRSIARLGDAVITLIWLTGLLLVWWRWPVLPGGVFFVKLLLVLLLTLLHAHARATGERMRRENNMALLPKLSILIGGVAASAALALVCAVAAFRG